MRRGDEDGPGDEGERLEEHRPLKHLARLRRALDLREGDARHAVPEAGSARRDHELGQQAALAVADQHHLAQRGIISLGIDVLDELL